MAACILFNPSFFKVKILIYLLCALFNFLQKVRNMLAILKYCKEKASHYGCSLSTAHCSHQCIMSWVHTDLLPFTTWGSHWMTAWFWVHPGFLNMENRSYKTTEAFDNLIFRINPFSTRADIFQGFLF